MKKELVVIDTVFEFCSDFGCYYFKDEEGNIYCWRTSSDIAYEEILEGATYLCTFKTTRWKINHDKFGEVEMIRRVRFKRIK